MAISPLFFFMFLVIQSTANAFNITEILSPFKQFDEYNSFLTGTGVATEINSLKAATVLVVSDDQCYYFNHLPGDVTKRKLSFQVLLDYYDESKLKSLKSGTSLATLYQGATMTVDHDSSGSVTFRSAGSGPNTGVKLLSTIESQSPSISVLQIATTVQMDRSAPPPSRTPPQQSPPVSLTVSTPSPPRKVLAPPLTSRDKNSPTPNASPNKLINEPPPASSLTPKVNNNAPPPSTTKSSNIAPPSQTLSQSNSTSQGPSASSPSKSLGLASSGNGSPVALPLKPNSTAATTAAAGGGDVQAPGSDQKSYAHARICSGNYLGSILVVFTTLWFVFTMN